MYSNKQTKKKVEGTASDTRPEVKEGVGIGFLRPSEGSEPVSICFGKLPSTMYHRGLWNCYECSVVPIEFVFL